MASRQKFKKDPGSTLDYIVDWAEWLIGGDFIVSSSWSIEAIAGDAAPLVEVAPPGGQPSFEALIARVWLAAGTRANTYTVTNGITTDQGRVDERSIFIEVRNK